MSKYSLPIEFWHEFVSSHWEKRPGIFKDLFDAPFLSSDQLFDAIVGMQSTTKSDRFWASREPLPRSRDDFQIVPLDEHGPRREDQSLDGFFQRARQQIGDIPVGLNLHRLDRSQPELWFKFREFVHDLNKISGELPSGRWDIDTFLGTYRTTPLGIHRDNASVFAIGVMGHRTYYTWPADYFKDGDVALTRLDTESIQEHLDKAVRMELGPGDLVYWPSSNWHFVTSDGQPSAVISVSAYFGKNLSDIVSNHIRHLISDQLKDGDFNRLYTMKEAITEQPVQLTAVAELLKQTASNGMFGDAMQRLWLTFCSADGLRPVLFDEDAELALQDEIFVDPRFPVLWKEMQDKTLMVAVNGLTFPIPPVNNAAIISILEQLNTGQPVIVEKFVAEFSQGDIPAEAVAGILKMLQQTRAFRKVRDS